ncbi:PKD-like family lipoprotein [Pedobacter nyackensis]|uniref:PKD-like family protein n=1 Tax=Pedobacter nyackensis TaxID=475255 RepID=A0A1W2EKY1_9SPHI|nr:PKD-like family lipoprotein [Pedobacter nyackensis]SMD10389.1 PKD-like family protein [Pedobacter nyackensis]
MKSNILSLLSFVILSMLLAACMKDKSNYDLKPINEIKVTALSTGDNIDILLSDTLRITPTVTQDNVTNGMYTYSWYMFSDAFGPKIELSDKKDLKVAMNAPLGCYTLMYVVKDVSTNITSTVQTHLTIISRFGSGIVVLEEKPQGGDISHLGLDGTIFRNLYSEANKGSYIPTPVGQLTGFYFKSGEQIQKPFYVFVSAPGRTTMQLDPETYQDAGPFSGLLASPPPAPVELSAIQGYWSGNAIYALVNGKVQFGAPSASTPTFDGALLGDYEVAPFIITSTTAGKANTPAITTNFICYDQKNGRFLWFTGGSVGQLNTYSTDMSSPGAFDPNNVKKKCVYACYSNQYAYYNWLMKDDAGKMYFYQIYPIGTQKAAAAYAEIPASAAMSSATIFAGSTQLPHIYYVSGNNVMVYDYKSNTATIAYTAASGEQITDMKFSVSRVAEFSTSYQILRTTGKLYISTYNGAEGKINEFDVSPTGALGSPVKTYSGFGKITSMFYKEKR